MAQRDRTTLKTYFELGDSPTEANFIDLLDSIAVAVDDLVTTSDIANETTGAKLVTGALLRHAAETYGGSMSEAEIVTAINTQLGGTAWQSGGGSLTDEQVKTAYENNPDTNAFTDANVAKVAALPSTVINSSSLAVHTSNGNAVADPSLSVGDAYILDNGTEQILAFVKAIA